MTVTCSARTNKACPRPLGQGSRRLPAPVPGDKHAINWALRLGDQKDVPARSEQNTLDQLLGIHRAVGTQRHKTIGGARLAGGNISDVVSQHIEPPDLDGPLPRTPPTGA